MSKKQKVKHGGVYTNSIRKPMSEESEEPCTPMQLQKQASIRRLRGKIKWEGDLKQSRASRLG